MIVEGKYQLILFFWILLSKKILFLEMIQTMMTCKVVTILNLIKRVWHKLPSLFNLVGDYKRQSNKHPNITFG